MVMLTETFFKIWTHKYLCFQNFILLADLCRSVTLKFAPFLIPLCEKWSSKIKQQSVRNVDHMESINSILLYKLNCNPLILLLVNMVTLNYYSETWWEGFKPNPTHSNEYLAYSNPSKQRHEIRWQM